MTITEFGVMIVLGLTVALALARLKEAVHSPTAYNPFASNPDDAII